MHYCRERQKASSHWLLEILGKRFALWNSLISRNRVNLQWRTEVTAITSKKPTQFDSVGLACCTQETGVIQCCFKSFKTPDDGINLSKNEFESLIFNQLLISDIIKNLIIYPSSRYSAIAQPVFRVTSELASHFLDDRGIKIVQQHLDLIELNNTAFDHYCKTNENTEKLLETQTLL